MGGGAGGMLGFRELNHSASAFVVIVVVVIAEAVELNLTATAACMDEFVVAHVDRDMMNSPSLARSKEQEVARLKFILLYRLSNLRLFSTRSRKMYALRLVDLPGKPAAVCA